MTPAPTEREAERAAVVAWLRQSANFPSNSDLAFPRKVALLFAADAIDRLDHLPKDQK